MKKRRLGKDPLAGQPAPDEGGTKLPDGRTSDAMEEKPAPIPAAQPEPAGAAFGSLDDAAAFIVQMDPAGKDDLSRLRQGLEGLRESAGEPAASTAASAVNILDAMIAAESPDASAIAEISELLDRAAELKEAADEAALPLAPDEPEPEEPASRPPAEDAADDGSSLLEEFISESREYLDAAEVALLGLETDPASMERINAALRAFHTIKGSSAFLEMDLIKRLAHQAESVLAMVRDRHVPYRKEFGELLFASVDVLSNILQLVVLTGKPDKPSQYDRLMDRLQAIEDGEFTKRSGDGPPGPERPEPDGEPEMAGFEAEAKATTETARESTVRIRTDRLDKLIDMVGELVIAHSMEAQDRVVTELENHELAKKVTHTGKIVRELQDLSMAMRMVPLRATFQRMARVVRDLAVKDGKQVAFVTEGDETEIDRNMVDTISEPLLHILRNAIDHGIEPGKQRIKAGKPESGTVRLRACHSGSNVVIEAADDGQGLDRQAIIAKAMEMGLVTQGDSLSDAEADNLIFMPGFSTSAKVTEVSGRGVGMDVVKRGVESLKGRIEIRSAPGLGCTFSLQLPLTLAITDGMLVRVGQERFIIPTININITLRTSPENYFTVAGRGEMVNHQGFMVPLFRLHRIFAIDGAVEDPFTATLILVGEDGRLCAFMVDEILGQLQVVEKSLGSDLSQIPGVAGGAILGDGRVGLILDTTALIKLVQEGAIAE